MRMSRPFRPHVAELNRSPRLVPGPVVALVALGAVPMVMRLLLWHSVLDLVSLIGTVVAMWALVMRPWKEGPANVDFLAEAMSLMAVGFVVVDRGGCITKVNRAFCELFGVDVDGDVKTGTSAYSLFLATGPIGSGSVRPERDLQELQSVMRSADSIRGANIERRDGRSFAMSSVPLRVNGQRLGMAVFWDDTQWNREQHEVSEARHDAERGRSAALSMVRLASHEIRGPVHAMLALMDQLAATNLDSHQATVLSATYDAGAGLRGVVDRVLDLSMLESGAVMVTATRMDLRDTVREVSAVVGATLAAKSVRFDAIIAEDLRLERFGDPVRIHQVLINLLVNAAKFTTVGVVSLTVRGAGDGWVKFVVSDTGPGIPPEVLDQVFHGTETLFVRSEGGSGLGLLISRQLVELLGGTMTVASSTNEGTVFVVELPLPDDDSVELSTSSVHGVVDDIGSASLHTTVFAATAGGCVDETGWPLVLVVDDCTEVLAVTTEMLRLLGASVEFTTDPFQAVHWCTTRPYDLVVIDAMMPGLDGPTTARTIRLNEEDVRVPILIATGDTSATTRQRCSEAGVDAYLVKPFSTRELGVMISGLVGKGPGGLVGLDQFTNDQSVQLDTVRMFLDRLPGRLGLVNEAVHRGDNLATANAAHALASSAAMFEVQALARSCGDLERRARNETVGDDSDSLLAVINRAAADAVVNLSTAVTQWEQTNGRHE